MQPKPWFWLRFKCDGAFLFLTFLFFFCVRQFKNFMLSFCRGEQMKVFLFENNQMYNIVSKQLDKIKQGLDEGRKQFIIVPDRFSLNMEKMIMEKLLLTATFDVEVLTFSRLANLVLKDFSGKKVLSMLEAILIVEYLISQNKDKLVCFQRVPLSSNFAKIIFDTISQLKGCKISANDVKNSLKNLPNINLKQKMQDIALIYDLYENYIKDNFVDSNNKLSILAEKLAVSDFFSSADVHFVNFYDFTGQDFDIIRQIIKKSNLTTFADLKGEGNNKDVFFLTIAQKIKDMADELGAKVVTVKAENHYNKINTHISNNLFAMEKDVLPLKNSGNIELFSAENIQEEVEFLVREILSTVNGGANFGEICVNCCDFAGYQNILTSTFDKYQIPYFLDEKISLTNTELAKLLLASSRCSMGGFLTDDVLKLVANGLVNLDSDEKESFFTYANKFGILGNMWLKKVVLKNEDEKFLQFDETKLAFIKPFEKFDKQIKKSGCVQDFADAFLTLMSDLSLEEKLQELSISFEQKGELKQASIFRQSFDKISGILSNISEILGFYSVSFNDFMDIFEMALETTQISPLPMGTNCVLIGQMLSTLFEPTKLMFVLGATEENLPAWQSDVGILTDFEIALLENIKITPTIEELNKKTVLMIVQNLSVAEKLVISYPANLSTKQTQISKVMQDLSKMFSFMGANLPVVSISQFNENKLEQGDFTYLFPTLKHLINIFAMGEREEFYKLQQQYFKESNFTFPTEEMPRFVQNAQDIFFSGGTTRPTELERYFSCPFLHFVEYGLRLKEKESSRVRPVDVGNILHDIAERFAKFEKNKDLSDKEIERFVNNAFDEIISKKDYEHLLFGEQNRFLTKSLKDESIRICKAIHFQNRHSKYKIVFTEYNFSTNGKPLPEIAVYQSKKVLKLKGKVDRIDFFKNRFRVLDYKTGKHKAEFKLLDLYLGRKMQLFIYLYALTKLFPDSTPTGAFYFPINNEYQDKKATSQFENYAYNGVTVNTEENFLAQDDLVSVDNPKSSIINFSLDVTRFNHTGEKLMKDTANALTENQMRALIDYAYALCGKALAEILDGYIEPKPLTESCTFCAVKNFCPFLRKEHQPRTEDFSVDKTTFEEVLK